MVVMPYQVKWKRQWNTSYRCNPLREKVK